MPAKKPDHTAHKQSALPAETADKMRALVRTLAKMAAEADYEASKTQISHLPKGSSS